MLEADTSADMQRLLGRIIRRTVRQLERDGVLVQDTEQPYFDFCEPNVQNTFNAASVRYRIAIGPNSGKKTLILRSDASSEAILSANLSRSIETDFR